MAQKAKRPSQAPKNIWKSGSWDLGRQGQKGRQTKQKARLQEL